MKKIEQKYSGGYLFLGFTKKVAEFKTNKISRKIQKVISLINFF